MVLHGDLAYDLIRFSSLCLYNLIHECYLCSMYPCFSDLPWKPLLPTLFGPEDTGI